MIFAKQIEKIYRKQLFGRCDDNGVARYFQTEDFPGLQREPYVFAAKAGHSLQGYLYHYEEPIPGRLVVFDHGMGGGHRSYMKEIEMLARHGFMVFAYDHTGCMESGGDCTNGFAQSLNDLDTCLTVLKADPRFADVVFSVVGHSWGAFSTMNVTALHPEIRHAVAMCGFVSVSQMLHQNFGGILKGFYDHIYGLEARTNPEYVKACAVESLGQTKAKVLLIYSADDPLVKKEYHYDKLEKGLSGKENIRLMLVHGKKHNPNYTEDAVNYLGEYTKALTEKLKKKELISDDRKKAFVDSFDWDRMTAQDETVWEEIFKTLDA